MLPTPSHLRDCTIPYSDGIRENQYVGHVQCPCDVDTFQLLHTGGTNVYRGVTYPSVTEIDGESYLRIAARCTGCGREHLLLDAELHGWGAYVRQLDSVYYLRPRPPLTPWPCGGCGGSSAFQADVWVQGEDLEDAMENSDGLFNESNWQEGFGWIGIEIQCRECGREHESWISYETM